MRKEDKTKLPGQRTYEPKRQGTGRDFLNVLLFDLEYPQFCFKFTDCGENSE
jgi:hypothetical protein